MSRTHYDTWSRVCAVLTSPSLYRLAQELDWHPPVGRPRNNPTYVLLAYGVLARLVRSGIRVELDLAHPRTWAAATEIMSATIRTHHLDLPPPGPRPPTWDHWRWIRNHRLTTDEGLADLARHFPSIAVETARRIGQLNPHGPGSLTHPDPSRCVAGDGTLIRPIYRPPQTVTLDNDDGSTTTAYLDPRTGELIPDPPNRYDPDLIAHHGKAGPVLTHGYVCWHTRGNKPYQRIDLAATHIPAPGAEAATAVTLLRDVHRAAATGIHAAIYDGALRGVHIEEIMTNYGYIVLAKQHRDATKNDTDTDDGNDASKTQLVQTPQGKRARSYPLGTVAHQLPNGPCHHTIAAAGGDIIEVDLDDSGDPVITSTLTRRAVKRARRGTGRYHFNVGYELNCPSEPFTIWLTPHPTHETETARPEHLRIIGGHDPDAQRLYGLRSDAESFHSHYKRTLIVDRAMSLGWRRGLIDLYCFSVYNNALTEHRAFETERTTISRTRN